MAVGIAQVLTIIGWIMAPVCSVLVAKVMDMRKKLAEEKQRADDAEKKAAQEASDIEKARIEIEKAMARQMIFDAYEKYVIRGEHMTIARYEELLKIYEAYVALGGNGTAKAYMEEIMKLKPYLVTE